MSARQDFGEDLICKFASVLLDGNPALEGKFHHVLRLPRNPKGIRCCMACWCFAASFPRRSPGGELHLIDDLISYWTAAVRVASLVSDSWDVDDFIGQGTVWRLQSNMPVAFVAERRAMHLGVSNFCCMQMTLLSSAKTQQTCKELQMQPLQGLELGGCVLVLVGTKCCTVCWPEARQLLPCNSTLASNHGRPFAVTLI